MVCVWGLVDNLNADFASDAERVQHHASGEEGDNSVHVEKMPDPTGVGGVRSISYALERSIFS